MLVDESEDCGLHAEITCLEHLLDDVIPELVVHQIEQKVLSRHRVDLHNLPQELHRERLVSIDEALLCDVAAALRLAETDEVVFNDAKERILDVLWPVFEQMLHHVVPVLAAAQPEQVLVDLAQNRLRYLKRRLLQDLLDHAAAVWVEH